MKYRPKALFQALLLLGCFLVSAFADDKSQIVEQGDKVQLNLNNVDLNIVVQYLSKFNDEHYLIDPTAKATISVMANKPVTRKDAAIILEQAMAFYGIVIVKDGLTRKVLPSRFAKQMGIDVKFGVEDVDKITQGGMEMRFFKLEHASIRKINTVLNTVIGRDGQIIPYVEDRMLQIIDTTHAMQRISDLIKKMDVPDSLIEMYIIHLENTQADPIINQLKNIFTKNLTLRNSPNEVEVDEDRINFFGDPRTNTIIAVTHPKYIDQIRETVRLLDQEIGAIKQVKVYPIRYSDPEALSKQLLDIFPAGTATINPDKRLNSLMILAQSERICQAVFDMAARLDVKGTESQSGVHVYYLEYTVAKDMAETLNKLFSNQNQSQNATSVTTGTPSGPLQIVPDEATNSLVITGSKGQFDEVVNVLKKLDIFRAQVMVEAVIVEVAENFAKNFGFSMGSLGSRDGALAVFGTAFGLPAGNINPAGNGLNLGVIDSSATVEDTITGKANGKIRAFLNAAQNTSHANVLSAPQIMTKDNQEAKIVVGEIISVPTGINTALNNVNNQTPINFSREDVGLDLSIKPRITQTKTITLEVKLDVRARTADSLSPLGGVNIPVITKRSLNTNISTIDGGTAVIGGLLSEDTNVSENKVPGLSKIPILGKAFRNKARTNTKKNLFIFLTPYVLTNNQETVGMTRKMNNTMLEAQARRETTPMSYSPKEGILFDKNREVRIERITVDGQSEALPDSRNNKSKMQKTEKAEPVKETENSEKVEPVSQNNVLVQTSAEQAILLNQLPPRPLILQNHKSEIALEEGHFNQVPVSVAAQIPISASVDAVAVTTPEKITPRENFDVLLSRLKKRVEEEKNREPVRASFPLEIKEEDESEDEDQIDTAEEDMQDLEKAMLPLPKSKQDQEFDMILKQIKASLQTDLAKPERG